jgi:hypothetical protein
MDKTDAYNLAYSLGFDAYCHDIHECPYHKDTQTLDFMAWWMGYRTAEEEV